MFKCEICKAAVQRMQFYSWVAIPLKIVSLEGHIDGGTRVLCFFTSEGKVNFEVSKSLDDFSCMVGEHTKKLSRKS